MFSYARRVLTSRPATWVGCAICALVAGALSALSATALAPSAVALLVSGDPGVAAALLPELLAGLSPGVQGAAGVVVVAGALALGARALSVALWASGPDASVGVRVAWRATRRTWLGVLLLYLQGYAAIALLWGLLLGPAVLLSGGLLGSLGVGAIVAAFTARTVIRIVLTLAARASVFEGCSSRAAWRRGRLAALEHRREAAAAWLSLMALGLSVWAGGRLLTPVLQDTAYIYRASSSYSLARQLGQLLVSVPLETFLMVTATGMWTAVWSGHTEPPAAPSRRAARREPRRPDPWVARGLAAVLGLALVGNAIPALVDASWQTRERARLARIAASEIQPEDALRRGAGPATEARTVRASYQVDAHLDGDELRWSTRIRYLNRTGEALRDLGVNVYPAAYTRPIRRIPLGADLLAGDFAGEFRAAAEAGTFDVRAVAVGGLDVPFELSGTALTVELPDELRPNGTATVDIALAARLPEWPERFGVWDDVVLLGNWIPTVAVRQSDEWRLDPFGRVGDPFFSEVADYTVDLEVDRDVELVGTGHLTAVEPGRRIGTRHWRFEAPGVRDAAFVAAPLLRGLERSDPPTAVRSWYPVDEREVGADNLRAAASAVTDLSHRFGDLPFDEVDVVATRGFLGAMEYPGLVMTPGSTSGLEGLPLLPELWRLAGFDAEARRYMVGHEIAHQWWYAAVGNDQVRRPWLDEALAEASARLWLLASDGDERAWKIVNGISEAAPRRGVVTAGVDDFESNRDYSRAIYLAGAEVLFRVRDEVGPRVFDDILAEWYRRQRGSIGTVPEFVDTVRDVAGDPAAEVLERYL